MASRFGVTVPVLAIALAACADQPTAVDSADAPEPPEASKGAVHNLPDPFCAVLDGVGDFVMVDCKQQIATYSANGNALVLARASGVFNPTGRVVTWDAYNPGPALLAAFDGVLDPPLPCVIPDVNGNWSLWTLNWKGTVTPSGQATFQCWYNEKWAFEWP